MNPRIKNAIIYASVYLALLAVGIFLLIVSAGLGLLLSCMFPGSATTWIAIIWLFDISIGYYIYKKIAGEIEVYDYDYDDNIEE